MYIFIFLEQTLSLSSFNLQDSFHKTVFIIKKYFIELYTCVYDIPLTLKLFFKLFFIFNTIYKILRITNIKRNILTSILILVILKIFTFFHWDLLTQK